MSTLSGHLGNQIPPAWAFEGGLLESIEDQSKVQQDQYATNGSLVKIGSEEAQANANNAAAIAQQEAQGLRDSAVGQIVGSVLSLATTGLSIGLTAYAGNKATTRAAGKDLENAKSWDTAIKDAMKQPSNSPTYIAADGIEMDEVGGKKGYVNPFSGEDGTSPYDNEVPGKLSELYGQDKEAFSKLADRVSKNKELLEKVFDNAQGEYRRTEDRLGSIGGALNSGSQAIGSLSQSQCKHEEIALQSAQKLAEFGQNAIGTTQSIITQAINGTGNQINSIAQAISAVAASNKVN
jgi:hypothetical protein